MTNESEPVMDEFKMARDRRFAASRASLTVSVGCLMILVSLPGPTAYGQDGSLLQRPVAADEGAGLTLNNSSFLFVPPPKLKSPREFRKEDIITVLVDYRTQVLSEGEFESRRTGILDATLSDWVLFRNGNLKPSPQSDGDPRVAGTLREQFRTEGDLDARDSLTFKIAAKIVDVMPNGNLVIEAHQQVQNNEEVWQQSLTGIVRRESINPDRTVKSEEIAELRITKREVGQVRDAYNRGWLKKIYDQYKPF